MFKRTVNGIEINLGGGLKEGLKDGQPVIELKVGSGVSIDATGELEGAAPSDGKVKTTTNDTTPGFLSSKLSFAPGEVVSSVLNPGANETLQLRLGSSGVISSGNHAVGGQVVTEINTTNGRIAAITFGPAGSSLSTGYEAIISVGPISTTIPHTDIGITGGGNLTLADGTVDGFEKSIAVTGGDAVFVLFNFQRLPVGLSSTGSKVLLSAKDALLLKWNATSNRWNVRIASNGDGSGSTPSFNFGGGS